MTDQLISFETAKLAKKKGFNQAVQAGLVSTQSLLQKWLREIHKIDVIIMFYVKSPARNPKKVYISYIYKNGKLLSEINPIPCKTYEESFEQGLQTALKLIK